MRDSSSGLRPSTPAELEPRSAQPQLLELGRPHDSRPRPRLAHLAGLDGLRGLAVLGVLLFHDGRLPGGYLGVDLFFVLSGFLITSNLLTEHQASGRIDLGAFWVRRARRLFPALLAVVIVVGAAAPFVASPAERARIQADGLAALAYVANWHTIVAGRSYWDLFAAPSPFEHTWSLSIEEQFYVAWPLVAWVALRARRPRLALGLVAAGLTLASGLALARAFDAVGASRAYLGTDTRAAAILAGAGMACALHGRAPLAGRAALALDAAGALALGGLALAWVRLEGKDPFLYEGGLWLSELAVLALVWCASQGHASRIARLLSFRSLAWVGRVSYGLYLVHWPIFTLLRPGRLGLSGAALTVVRLALTFLVAAASFRWLEDPIRRRGLPFGRAAIVVPASFAAAAAALVLGTHLPARAAPPAEARGPSAPRPAAEELPPGAPRRLVLGGSVAAARGERHAALGHDEGVQVFAHGIGDCSLFEGVLPTRSLEDRPHSGGNCAARWESDVLEMHPDVTLVVLGGGFFAPVRVERRWRWACDDAFHRAYARELTRRLEVIRARAGRLVIARVPYPVGTWKSAKLDERTDCFNELLEGVARRVPDVEVLDLARRVCPSTDCELESEGEPIRPDGLHFQGRGADATTRWVLASLGRRGEVRDRPASAPGPRSSPSGAATAP